MTYLNKMHHKLVRYFSQQLKAGSFILVAAIYGQFLIGSPNDDVISDLGHQRDFIYAESGNDVVVYTPSLNIGRTDHYDGGSGIDTLWLRMTKKEFYHPEFQADLVRFHYFLMKNTSIASHNDKGEIFQFKPFDLRVRNFENIVIEKMGSRGKEPKPPAPKDYFHIKDTAVDTLV